MKKILYLLLALFVGTLVFADTIPQEFSTGEAGVKTNATGSMTEVEYTTCQKGNTTFYYDKYGKLLAHDKKVNNEKFYYNRVGQLVGRSVKRNDKTYYYNQLSKFIGVCDEDGNCQDKDFASTGKLPPLPAIKHFVPDV